MNKKITIRGEEYYYIGCRVCERGEWAILRKGDNLFARCKCGHIIKIDLDNIVDKPNIENKARVIDIENEQSA